MTDHPTRTELLRLARTALGDAARPDVVTRIRKTGKLTARERMALLADAGSMVSYGTIAAVDPNDTGNPWVAETGGLDAIATIDGHPAIISTTDYTDHGGGYGAARLGRLFALAREHRWPFVAFVDGGGSRARHPRNGLGHIELSGAIGPYTLFDGMAELSGWVPTISIVSGPSFAGHASVAGFSDIVIATRGSAIGMGGPPMVEAAIGRRLTPTELSGAQMQYETGGIELLAGDETEAVATARRLLGYWHTRDTGPARSFHNQDAIASLVPSTGPYEIQPVIDTLTDPGSFIELRGGFARALVAGVARLNGRAIGVLASNPAENDGLIDEAAAQKINRHVELCDAWELPLLVLIDSTGTTTRWQDKARGSYVETGLSRVHLRCIVSHQTRTVPLLSVQLRSGRGLAPALMTGYSTGASVPVFMGAWPDAELNRADGYALVRDANAFDDIIDPRETRTILARLIRLLPLAGNREAKQHPVDSW